MKNRWFAGALTGAIVLGGFSPATMPAQAETANKGSSAPNLVSEATIGSQQTFSLLDAGAEPRQALRFTPQASETQTTTMTMMMNVLMSAGGQVLPFDAPTTILTFESEITQVDDNGDIHFQMSCTDAEVGDSTNAPPEVRQVLEAQIQNLVGFGGTMLMDSRGNVKESNFSLSETADPMMQELFDQISQSVDRLSAPFPEEAVGLGARWQIAHAMNVNGIKLTQTAIYELVSMDNNVATLNVTLEQQAPPQQLESPGLPPSATVTLNSMQARGEGQVTIRLDRLMPEIGTMSLQSNTDMSILPEGMAQAMPMTSTTMMQMEWQSQ